MRGRRAFAAALAMGALHCVAQPAPDLTPKISPPKPRPGLDESFIIAVPKSVDAPCVAVLVVGARILVSRKHLEALASAAPISSKWKDEAQRMAMIRGDRARELLAGVQPATGIECPERAPGFSSQVEFLLGALLLSGTAAVVDEKDARVTGKIRVQYEASRVGGFVTFHLDRGESFLSYAWFVT